MQQQQQQQHQLDPTEVELGISVYLSNNNNVPGFSAVSKARFSDFVVHEVGTDGRIARLESMEPTVSVEGGETAAAAAVMAVHAADTETNGSKKRKLDDDVVDATSVAPPPPPDWMSLQTELENFVGSEAAAQVTQFLQQHEASTIEVHGKKGANGDNNDATATTVTQFVTLPPVAEKEQRRALHGWIKTKLSFAAAADTVADSGQIRVWHRSFTGSMPNKLDNNNNTRQTIGSSAPRDKPFLRFVLYKENTDSSSAMQQISTRASFVRNNRGGRGGGGRGGRNHHNNNAGRIRLGYAGNKDKRGITSQFITVAARDTSVKHLCNVFNNNNNSGSGHTKTAGVGMIRLGNFEYCAHELRLGRLRGNRFDVALRNVVVAAPAPVATVTGNDATTTTTANSSAMIGTPNSCKEALERAATAIRSTGFINYFGTQRFGKYHDTHLTGMAVLRGDYGAAVDLILRASSSSSSKATDRDDVDERDGDIRAARILWRNRFILKKQQEAQQLESDTVKEKEEEEVTDVTRRAAMEKEVAGKVLQAMNRFMHSEISVLSSLTRYPLDYKKAFSCITKTMRMMFIHALQSFFWNKVASFRIEKLGRSVVKGDLVLLLAVGSENESAGNSQREGCPDVKVVTDEDVAAGRYTLEDVVLPLIGVKTRNPENESGELFDTLLKENNITRDMINTLQDRDFHCAGDYRNLICRPTDIDFEIIEYKDELQPLLQTDYMKLNGIEVERISGDGSRLDGKDPLLAMVVGFSLPSSSYATIFLRELMKRPTSSEYQRELKLGGVAETELPDDEDVATDDA